MKTKLVIFDLDGTLLDTIGDLAVCCNHVLGEKGFPQHSLQDYRRFVGNGIKRLIDRALPEGTPEKSVEDVRKAFVSYYYANIDVHTVPYPGIVDLLCVLERTGIAMAVASNKFQEGTSRLIGTFFPEFSFVRVFGQRPGVPLKPDPAVINEIVAAAGLQDDLGSVLYAGDSGIDMDTAAAAGVRSVGVTWGFRPREELVAHGACHIAGCVEDIVKIL